MFQCAGQGRRVQRCPVSVMRKPCIARRAHTDQTKKIMLSRFIHQNTQFYAHFTYKTSNPASQPRRTLTQGMGNVVSIGLDYDLLILFLLTLFLITFSILLFTDCELRMATLQWASRKWTRNSEERNSFMYACALKREGENGEAGDAEHHRSLNRGNHSNTSWGSRLRCAASICSANAWWKKCLPRIVIIKILNY